MDAARVHEELIELKEDVALIRRAVVGEPKSGQVGLVKRVERLEREHRMALLKAAAVAGAVGGGIWGGAGWVAKLLGH